MNLIIKPLTPSLAADYFDFFDNRAFSDNSPFYPCYCNAFQMTEEQIKTEFFERAEAKGGGTEEFRKAIRESAVPMVERGIIQGYLAYDNDLAIGWCNANDRKNYIRVGEFNLDTLSAEYVHHIPSSEEASRRIKSIVCFEIAPEYRGKGIASALFPQATSQVAVLAWIFGDCREGQSLRCLQREL